MVELLTAKETAKRLRVAESTVYLLASQNRIPLVRLGERMVRFPAAELEWWLQSQVRLPAADRLLPMG